ncbi:uncharacterized protein SAMN05892883_2705 [Jatrophihabitans sp. GAS493]|uniref:transglutaminase family protein n=1 Tax=Jatrophihabitans sp. GAS493 TaxID=1907575 RepID=UPI000BB80C20|nr:transglutaminase family protein [Jatrophihabitans sp. GAS493]SOD73412.1 uncharacterized protein SAMN05892883_2705 [Jatrophihabitans sp. GAS493]
MAVHVAVKHRTTYQFDRPVHLGPHVIRLRPAPHSRTRIENYSLTVSPTPHFLNWQQDPFGNHLARVVFPERVTELDVTVELIADMTVINPFDFFVEEYAEKFPFSYEPSLAADLEAYRRPVVEPGHDGNEVGPLLRKWLDEAPPIDADGVGIVQFLAALNARVAGSIAYTVRMEHGVQTPDQTLDLGIGSCRDSAWMLVSALREVGLAARFVSGYLVQLAPDVPDSPDGVAPLTEDFTDLHAWAEVYLPGAGWVGMDATSGLFAGEGHIPLSATPSPAQSAPITGTVDPCITTMEFVNEVRRIREDPRVTKPYTDRQWDDIMAVGHAVDAQLTADDVRLTIGGEPTFVSVRDMESEQWSIAADGPEKRTLATELAAKMKQHYAPAGVLHHGQGKWYPGEPLPRWQIAITWRLDDVALWRDADLLDDPWGKAVIDEERANGIAHRFALLCARGVGIDDDFVLPAYEDRLQMLADEAKLPADEAPEFDLDPELSDARDARRAVVAELDREVVNPTGYVLPLHRSETGDAWATARWRTRRGHLVLIPGTSAVGLRLPLNSISWEGPPPRPVDVPFSASGDLPSPEADLPPASVTPIADAPTTALAVEVRDGHLFVFLPPLDDFDSAVELLRVLEDAAMVVGVPIVIEGYGLPGDPRTRTLTVTPDPGVIEVNVQPAASWDELVEINHSLHTAAHEIGLGTEKFALDGTYTGTGGGSHITLGGPTPADSPILRRPDLLISMLTFWQHHPSLSYLFSGRFIGPTSQAPRVDEARHDYLYELEIAFAELDRLGADARPWAVDRSLRHLLTDLTGNTHRAEFCIDKLFSPDSSRGRLGLLELRGFEMPPHEQMSLVQALLVRALVARFWREPYRGDLVRWGTQLHDRFLLPAFVAADIAEVVADLNSHGIEFDLNWMTPFVEFRFPQLGAAQLGPVHLELRSAIEPWHVLGEEATGSGTARYVDSSVERVQVEVTGATPGRYSVTCNGAPLPLAPLAPTSASGGTGALVAGVRFKAWAPPSGLHPTIGVHSPLIFEVIDLWTGDVVGSCTFHVVHPGGRSYDRFPVNANEAEARRSSRFVLGGSIGDERDAIAASAAKVHPGEMLYTMDLRRVLGAG